MYTHDNLLCCVMIAVAEQLEQQLGLDHFLTYRLWDQITQLHQEQVCHGQCCW